MFEKKDLLRGDPNLENPHVLGINRMAPRATMVPAQKSGVYYRNKEESNRIRLLNGTFRFAYCPEGDTMPEFFREECNDSAWDTIDVPSMWQFRGYGEPTYPNVRYPIPFDPPFVKVQNPVGYYRRSVQIDTPAPHTILHFAGVDNAFYVYWNGELVGFSKGSRLPSEFDISHLVRKGENTLAVKVFTYSDATYLENQDMLMANGIFRDVYLVECGADYLWDYRVTTTYSSITVKAKLHVENPGVQLVITLAGKRVVLPAEETVEYTFELENPKLWNAEQPNLYDLTLELQNGETVLEVHSKRVGILHTRVDGVKLLVNEQPIMIKGVNRHEVNWKNGRAITVEQIESDLREIKANNLNAIRLSHYTNHPATYEIASEIGLYLMDEADLETHGAECTGDQGFLTKNPDWLEAYQDRVRRMLVTNQNETSVFLWSVGNECGRGENLERCIDLVRAFDPTRESVITQDHDTSYTHFWLIGYYPMKVLDKTPTDVAPVIAIEYAHAMGNSSGTLKDYWDYNYTHEHMAGGFVWEFKSHGFYAEDENGVAFCKYGGDFSNNEYHWGNFCMDGYHMSDGTAKHTWHELGEVSFAAYAVLENGRVRIKNTNDFTTLSAYTATYEILEDYRVIRSGAVTIPEVAPHEWFTAEEIDLTVESPKPGAVYYLNLYFAKNGETVSRKQFTLPVECPKAPVVSAPFAVETSASGGILTVKGSNFCACWEDGILCRYEVGGKLLLNEAIRPNFYRAPMDNDGIRGLFERHIGEWDKRLLNKWQFHAYEMAVKEQSDRVTVQCVGKMYPTAHFAGYRLAFRYEIFANGVMHLTLSGDPYGDLPETLPRIGLILPLEKRFAAAQWYGRGPRENYSDCKSASLVGLYENTVENLYTVFDYPQESGNHEDVGFVRVLGNAGEALAVSAQGALCFSLHDFSLEALDNARHKNELTKDPAHNYLYLDYKMRGLGGKSCGPDPEEAYELRPHSFRFSVVLSAEDAAGALALTRTDFGAQTAARSETFHYTKPKHQHELLDCNIE